MRTFEFIVSAEEEGMGIKRLLKAHFHFSSRLFAKLKRQEAVLLNDKPLKGWMNPKKGDVIKAVFPPESSDFPEEPVPIHPVYEDEDLLIINKPAGFTVHPTNGHPCHTMANGIMRYMRQSDQQFKIRFVNRLDMDTSGLLIVAKHSHSQDELMQSMAKNRVKKYYQAVVDGVVEDDKFTLDLPIGHPNLDEVARQVVSEDDPCGKRCITHVQVIERFKNHSLVELGLETGRTHQIRVHMSHIGHPITGDEVYGRPDPFLIDRQALHAFRLIFPHPVEDRMVTVEAPLPSDIVNVLNNI